jgi:hypothetical protein
MIKFYVIRMDPLKIGMQMQKHVGEKVKINIKQKSVHFLVNSTNILIYI